MLTFNQSFRLTSWLNRNVTIRHATLADIDSLLALQQSAPTASQWSAEQYRQAISKLQPARLLLVIEDESAVQGFLVAVNVDHEWEIENVVVASGLRRQGLGKRLLDEFLIKVRMTGTHSIFLEVRESNLPARHLYERFGFKESGRRKHYYHRPEEDAVLYRLDLA